MIFTHWPRVSLASFTFSRWHHNQLLMTLQWPDHCGAIMWIVISNSLDIDFIHRNIWGRLCKKLVLVMPWCCQAKGHYLNLCWLNQYPCQWVNMCKGAIESPMNGLDGHESENVPNAGFNNILKNFEINGQLNHRIHVALLHTKVAVFIYYANTRRTDHNLKYKFPSCLLGNLALKIVCPHATNFLLPWAIWLMELLSPVVCTTPDILYPRQHRNHDW